MRRQVGDNLAALGTGELEGTDGQCRQLGQAGPLGKVLVLSQEAGVRV